MKKAMYVGDKILEVLESNPGEMTISDISELTGLTKKATNAALGRLLHKGYIERTEKGIYCGIPREKGRKPASARKSPAPESQKAPEPMPAPVMPLSIIAVELLVEGEEPWVDPSEILGKILADKTVLDARVASITPADQTKLKVRFSF